MYRIILSVFVSCAFFFTSNAQEPLSVTVAQDGSGDYNTIQAAIDAVPENTDATIFIKAGVYDECVNIGTRQKTSTKRISMKGEDRENTIITSSLGLKTTPKAKDIYQSAALAVYANDFYAEDITFRL